MVVAAIDVGDGLVVEFGALVLVAADVDPSLLHAARSAASGAAPAPSTVQRARSRRLIARPRHPDCSPMPTAAVCQPAWASVTTRNAGKPGAAAAMSASDDSAVRPSKNLPTSHAHAFR